MTLSLKNQALPSASSLTSAGWPTIWPLVSITSPEIGANTSLAAFTLSTTATGSPVVHVAADIGQLDEHHVAELVLGVVGDADGGDVIVDADPFVVPGEALGGHVISLLRVSDPAGLTPWLNGSCVYGVRPGGSDTCLRA